MSELYHYGRSKKDGAPVGSGRYPLGSGESNKNKNTGITLSRYSNAREKEIRKGSYFFVDSNIDDKARYFDDFFSGLLSGKPSNDRGYKITIKSVSPITVRRGQDVVHDIMPKIKNKYVEKSYNILMKKGFFDGNRDNIMANESLDDDRKTLAFGIHPFVKNNKTVLADIYKEAGYDAIVDPEDYVFGFDLPLIITNPDKFRISKAHKITLKKENE